MIRYGTLCFFSVCLVTSWISAVMFFLLSAQADDRVRVEKRDKAQFEFASAMNTVTEFYCHTQEKGVFVPFSHPDTQKQSLRPRRTLCYIVSEWRDCDSWCGYLWKRVMLVCLCPPGSRSLSCVASMESPVICCLGPLIQYLQEFHLERVLRSQRYMWDGADAQQRRLQSVMVQSCVCSLNPGWT